MRMVGIEPTLEKSNKILSLACLPVPPHSHEKPTMIIPKSDSVSKHVSTGNTGDWIRTNGVLIYSQLPSPLGYPPKYSTFTYSFLCMFTRKNELQGTDLNRRPSGYDPDELPDCYHPAIADKVGLEPTTNRLTVGRSTYWATCQYNFVSSTKSIITVKHCFVHCFLSH